VLPATCVESIQGLERLRRCRRHTPPEQNKGEGWQSEATDPGSRGRAELPTAFLDPNYSRQTRLWPPTPLSSEPARRAFALLGRSVGLKGRRQITLAFASPSEQAFWTAGQRGPRSGVLFRPGAGDSGRCPHRSRDGLLSGAPAGACCPRFSGSSAQVRTARSIITRTC
jgi:hypothetical protein